MQGFPKYGDIENLYRATEVLEHSVVVTEKLHGTNVRVMWTTGGLVLGGRNEIIYKDGQSTNHDGYGFGAFMEKHPALEFFSDSGEYDDYVFFGEYHGANIQKGVKYCDQKDFRVFDVVKPDGTYCDWEDVVEICRKVGFKTVPVLLEGRVTLDDLNALMNKNSQTAIENGFNLENNIAEGVVVKPLKAKLDKHGNPLRAKFKSEKWAENAKAPKVKRAPNPDMIELQKEAKDFADAVVTEGRVATIVEHITRDGNTTVDVKRTGEFLREFINDLMKEYKELYDQLERPEQNVYNKVINTQAVKLWQNYLIKQ